MYGTKVRIFEQIVNVSFDLGASIIIICFQVRNEVAARLFKQIAHVRQTTEVLLIPVHNEPSKCSAKLGGKFRADRPAVISTAIIGEEDLQISESLLQQ